MIKYITAAIAASLVFSGGCSAQMIEYDLVNFPEYEQNPGDPSVPFKWKVQCPADARCFLNTNTTSVWGPDPDENFRQGSWDLKWYYFLNGSENNISLDTLFQSANNDPFIGGTYCDENSTCSIICTDSCLCGLEWVPTVECAILEEYPETVLPEREERTIYEYLQDFSTSATDGMTMELRCADFLTACYLDQDFFKGSASNTYESNDEFFAIDYVACIGDEDATIPCRFGCDPGCTCTMVDQADGSTSECTVAPPTAAPTDAPTNLPTESPTPGSGASSLGVGLVGSILGIIAFKVVMMVV